MKIFRITMLVVAVALLGSAFTVDAKVKKRRSTTKKEKTMPQPKKSVNEEPCALDMVEYHYSYMRMTPWDKMRLERKDGKVVMTIKGTTTEEQEFVIEDGEQMLRAALEIIEQEKMLDYGVSYEPEIHPLDGYAWWFSARLSDGRSVSSHGRNATPTGDGLGRMGTLLRERAMKLLNIE